MPAGRSPVRTRRCIPGCSPQSLRYNCDIGRRARSLTLQAESPLSPHPPGARGFCVFGIVSCPSGRALRRTGPRRCWPGRRVRSGNPAGVTPMAGRAGPRGGRGACVRWRAGARVGGPSAPCGAVRPSSPPARCSSSGLLFSPFSQVDLMELSVCSGGAHCRRESAVSGVPGKQRSSHRSQCAPRGTPPRAADVGPRHAERTDLDG
jgi:hypothetical protein